MGINITLEQDLEIIGCLPADETIAEIIRQGATATVENPAEALKWADKGIELAKRFNTIRLARMIGFRGSALRAAGRYREAEKHFNEALERIGNQSPADKGDVLRRLACLRICQERIDEASKLAAQALVLIKEHGSRHQYGQGLIAKGVTCHANREYNKAVQYFSECLCYLDYKILPVAYHGALRNLIAATVKASDPGEFDIVFQAIKTARSILPPNSHMARLKLKWIEGLANLRLGMNNRAVVLLREVSRKFKDGNQDQAMLLVDLSKAYGELPDYKKAAGALRRALGIYRSIEGVKPEFIQTIEDCLKDLGGPKGRDPWDVRAIIGLPISTDLSLGSEGHRRIPPGDIPRGGTPRRWCTAKRWCSAWLAPWLAIPRGGRLGSLSDRPGQNGVPSSD